LQNDSSDVRNHLLWKEDHTTQQLKKSNLYKREEADLNKNGHPLSEKKNDTPSSTTNHVFSGIKMTATSPDKPMQPDKADSTTHTIKGELKQQKENHPRNHLMWKRGTAVNRN
jgi:hypothetical protein